MKGLLDTSAVVLLPELSVDDLPPEPMISVITLAELAVGPLATDDPLEQARRQALLQQVEADFVPLPFDAGCARAFGRVAASLRAADRKVTARAYDALIAATALAKNLPLYTANVRDVSGIDGLEVVPVPRLAQ